MRKKRGKGVVITAAGFVLGAAAAYKITQMLPAEAQDFKGLIFFGTIVAVGGVITFLSGRWGNGRR